MEFEAGSAEGKQLEARIGQQIENQGLSGDAGFVAEYVTVLLANQRPADEIVSELTGLVGDSSAKAIADLAVNELHSMHNAGGSENTAETSQNPPDGPRTLFGVPAVALDEIIAQQKQESRSQPSRFNQQSTRGGIGKTRKPGSHLNSRNKAVVAGMMESGDISMQNPRNDMKIRERCRHWPGCSYPNCKFIHPTKKCHRYPNCARINGSCTFLHPEDEALLAQFQASLNAGNAGGFQPAAAPQEPEKPRINVCRFGTKCANSLCTAAHPSPEADDGFSVSDAEWCNSGIKCTNKTCPKSHPSPSIIKKIVPKAQEKVLEQCRFLANCTNPVCRFRHPRSTVLCREGTNCQRIDCLFSHPFLSECRFKSSCKNSYCLYQHPPERESALEKNTAVWVRPSDENNIQADTSVA